jgi:chemotaxis protein methyltransferase CheR
VSLWSAGSSTGQEPYSLAMLIHEYALGNGHLNISKEDFGLLATDISSAALSRAMAGEYTEMEIKRGLSPDRVEKYFRRDERRWVINSCIRIMVDFRQVNLVKPLPTLGGFDVILCRNVLIYFDDGTKTTMIDRLYEMVSEGGFLLLGATENLYGITHGFESLHYGKTLMYRKPAENSPQL